MSAATPPSGESSEGLQRAGPDFESANAARMYDYYLGGAHNFAVDRERAEQVIAAFPATVAMARANRNFLRRVVIWCLDRGLDQFLDLGSGVPTVGNVHEIAHDRDPHARVAYVDFEPVAAWHAQSIIDDLGLTTVTITRADARDPASVLAAPGVAELLDFDRPIAVLMLTLLAFVEGDMAALLDRYQASLVSGSIIAISSASDDQPNAVFAEQMRQGRAVYDRSTTPIVLRDRVSLRRGLAGVDVVDPGLVDVIDWPGSDGSDPETGAVPAGIYGAVGIVR